MKIHNATYAGKQYMIRDYILIIGAMKSGTTTVFDALSHHPAITPCRPKEPGFFAFEEVWAQGFDWYENLFQFDPKIHRFALDGSTDYTKRPFCEDVAKRLVASAPRNFHLIYIMRDPIKRIESHARHTQRTKREVGRFLSPRTDHSLDHGISPVNLAASRYFYQLEPYRRFHQQGRLYLTTLEALKLDHEAEMLRIFDFLGLLPEKAALVPQHSNKAEENRRATWLSNRLEYGRTFGFLNDVTRKRIAFRFKKSIEVSGRFKVTDGERAELEKILRPEINQLRSEFKFPGCDAWDL